LIDEAVTDIRDYTITPQPGDIVLVRGLAKASTFIVKAQRFFRAEANYSHALLNISGRLWCEAMPGYGVRIVTTSELFRDLKPPCKPLILRPPRPEPQSPKNMEVKAPGQDFIDALNWVNWSVNENLKWLFGALYYVGQPYNFGNLIPKRFRDKSKFCSELIAAVYRDLHIPPFSQKSPECIWPADLEALRNDPQWTIWCTDRVQAFLNCEDSQSVEYSEDQERQHIINCVGTITLGVLSEIKSIDQNIRTWCVNQLLFQKSVVGIPQPRIQDLKSLAVHGKELSARLKSSRPLAKGAPWLAERSSTLNVVEISRGLSKSLRKANKVLSRSNSWQVAK
jgi:hypothetical protein